MGTCNIEYKGKYACFTSVSDAFMTEFMNKDDYEEWRLSRFGDDLRPIEYNLKSMEKAAFWIRMNRSQAEAIECLLDCGLSEEEAEQIMFDMETKYYVPIPIGDNKFKCPNCDKEIKKDQVECDDDFCCLEFVWRK